MWILTVLAAIFFLRTARELLIPIGLAVLISYALEPIVAWLERHHVPRIPATSLVLLILIGVDRLGAYALPDDAMQVVEARPEAVDWAREMVLSQLR